MSSIIELQDAFKEVTADQDKIRHPAETVKRFKARLEKIDLKILQETVRIDNGRLGIPVFFSKCAPDAIRVTGTRKQMGKGATPEQAEASAVMELAERFSFFSFSSKANNFCQKKYPQVKAEAIPFEMIAASVHDTSDDLPVARKIFEDLPLKWTRGYRLTQGQEALIPFDWFFAINAYNGPSAGNCVEEALVQGICEIVERHTSSIVSRNGLRVPGIRPDSATNPLVLEMISKYRRCGIHFFISDFSLSMGIPTVGMLAYDPATFPETSEIVWTAGTSPDPQKALSRALTEVAQLAGDFNSGSCYEASGLPKFTAIKDAGFITHPGVMVDIDTLPNRASHNIRHEVESCVEALAQKDMEVLAIDTTHPLLKIPAFYTIVPGAHFRERAHNTSVAMFAGKLLLDKFPANIAARKLFDIDAMLPGKYYIKFYLGSCFLNMDDPKTAYRHFGDALSLEPHRQDMPSIYSYMGVCLKDQGRYTQALTILEQGAAVDPERTDIHNLMGFCHFKLKNHAQAIEQFKRVIQLDPGSAIDYANIASNYREMGKKKKAIEYYQMALSLDPGIDFARKNLNLLKGTS